MPQIEKLKELSVDDLLQELRAREAKTRNIATPLKPSESLREFDEASIIGFLKKIKRSSMGQMTVLTCSSFPQVRTWTMSPVSSRSSTLET